MENIVQDLRELAVIALMCGRYEDVPRHLEAAAKLDRRVINSGFEPVGITDDFKSLFLYPQRPQEHANTRGNEMILQTRKKRYSALEGRFFIA